MPAPGMPLDGGTSDSAMLPESMTGQRRPPSQSSSPNPKGDREFQQMKKRAKATVLIPDNNPDHDEMLGDGATGSHNIPDTSSHRRTTWGSVAGAAKRLFSDAVIMDLWYTADSDS
ncbi:unnamed protein product [Linum trigynum]|uniref:Uncharacterized protein n=1 Tax=Linum trigynum TaxID=586398 RepID=A0AAV2ETE2_9ROSI